MVRFQCLRAHLSLTTTRPLFGPGSSVIAWAWEERHHRLDDLPRGLQAGRDEGLKAEGETL